MEKLRSAILSVTTANQTQRGRRTSTGCTPSCAGCPARRGARTGCATASNPTGPAPAAVPARLMIENTSASAAVVSWSPATGPARPCPNTEPTGPRSSVKHCSPAGMAAPDLERMATDVLSPDGLHRYVWTDERPDPTTYTLMLLRAVAERQRWRAQYDQAKTRPAVETVDSLSAIGPPSGGGPPSPSVAHSSASPDNPPNPGPQDRQSRVKAANPQDRSEATALDGRAGGPTFTTRGRPSPSTQSQANADRRRTGDDHDHE